MTKGRPLEPLIVIPDDICGPALLALSPPMRAFVYAKVHFGCSNAEAARRAGYSKDKAHNAKVTAYQLAHRDDVQAAIIEASRKVMASEGPRSIKTLVDIRDDKGKDAKDRIKAATELLNRGGLNAVSEHHVKVEHRMTDAQRDARIVALCKELGISDGEARKMLVAPDVIDAEFTEVEPEKTPEQAERAERYRRTHEGEKQNLRRHMSPDELTGHKIKTRAKRSKAMKDQYAAAQGEHQTDCEDFIDAGGNEEPMSADGLEDLL